VKVSQHSPRRIATACPVSKSESPNCARRE
jgi:hypothetical protein